MQSSIVMFSKVVTSSKLFRFDAEYFQPKYIRTEELIKKHNHYELRSLISLLTDYHANGSYEILRNNVRLLVTPDYAHMIRTVDIERDDFENNIISIDEHAYEFLTKTKVFGGEIIINKIGNAGRAYLIPPIEKKTSLGMNQFMLRVNKNADNYYLYCYLSGEYGQNQLQQRITGAVPVSIDKESTRSVLVPIFSNDFQKVVHRHVQDHFEKIRASKYLYNEAENVILQELRLLSWQPKHQLTFVKNYSDTLEVERIDAEYFQPKYDEIVKAIKSYAGGWETLGNIASVKKCVEVGTEAYMDDGDVPFVRVSNLSPFEITEEKYISNELYAELSQHQPQKGEILFSKDGTPGIAYHLNEKPKKMIPSGGILRLKLKNKQLSEDYLTLVLNSIVVQEQINRDVGGSIILHWRPDQVKQTVIPILDDEKQQQIAQKIAEAFDLRKQSKHLLECAKRAVEIAIEQNEDAAIKWLHEQTKEAG